MRPSPDARLAMPPSCRPPRLRLVSPLLICALAFAAGVWSAAAQEMPRQYRAFWVDTFNTRLNNLADVEAVVARAERANANLLLVQVRRRGDSWYLNSLEPLPDQVPIERDFDPLRAIVELSHARGLAVHAFVSVAAIWNSLTPPSDPRHVFNRHGVDPATGRLREGRDNWLTRTLLADGQATSMGGHRFGNDFWIDLGHPDAAAYTVDVLLHLVANYDIDGLHLDRIRYPEISVSGQTPATGASVGYNAVSVARFNRWAGRPGDAVPAAGDELWGHWRRDQVTQFVRRVYLEVLSRRPHVVVSAAVVAFGGAPPDETAWPSAEPYWRVFQDWRAWQEEGIVDLMLPMVYKTQHTGSGRDMFASWTRWAAAHRYARHSAIGLGAYLNSIEGTLQQVRLATTSALGAEAALQGVAFFSMAASNAPVLANPLSIPAGRDTPLRPFDDFASALRTGRLTSGQLVDAAVPASAAVFADAAAIPEQPWKSDPLTGHLMGTVLSMGDEAVDAAWVTAERLAPPANGTEGPGRSIITVLTDGNGFYGAVDLTPGSYLVKVIPVGSGELRSDCTVEVTAGTVARLDLVIDGGRPVLAACRLP